MSETVFKTPELDIESSANPITVGMKRKTWFLHPLDHWKMEFHRPGKYSINKPTVKPAQTTTSIRRPLVEDNEC